MSGIGTLTALVMECSHAPGLARFWSKVLGVEISESQHDWASLEPSTHGRICFQSVTAYEPPEWPGRTGAQQLHLDLLVDDLDLSTTSVLEWGATALTDVLDPGPKAWRVFADPAGHPFCLVTVPE